MSERERWAYQYTDHRSLIECSEETARAKAELDWSVQVWQSLAGEDTWTEVATTRPDGTYS